MLGELKPRVMKSPGRCHAAGKVRSKDSSQVSPAPGQCSDNHSTEHPATEKETERLRTSIRPLESNSAEESTQDEKSEALSVIVSPVFRNQPAVWLGANHWIWAWGSWATKNEEPVFLLSLKWYNCINFAFLEQLTHQSGFVSNHNCCQNKRGFGD